MKFLSFPMVILLFCLSIEDVRLEEDDWPLTKKCEYHEGFEIERLKGAEMCLYWSETTKSFEDAQKDCEERGARLGVFKNSVLFEILKKSFRASKFGNVWVGLDDRTTEGTFVWHDGTVFENYTQYFAEGNLKIDVKFLTCL